MWLERFLCCAVLAHSGCVAVGVPVNGSLTSLYGNGSELLELDFHMAGQAVGIGCSPSSINDFPPDSFTQHQRASGVIVVHILVIIYMCGVISIVCDRYFLPSLEIICEYCGLSSDVAGATLMAMGTSAPELFSAVIGSFVTEGDIGIGTIVGSAVFNILGVTALIGLAVNRTDLTVDWFPISRDCVTYALSVILLVVIISDNYVTWYEASFLLLFYALYVVVMIFNVKIERASQRAIQFCFKASRQSEQEPLITREPSIIEGQDKNDPGSIFAVPDGGCFAVFTWLIFLPANVVLTCTIPDVSHCSRSPLSGLTFVLSIIWIGLSSYISIWMVTVVGYTFGLPDVVSGLTILAVSTSIPEVFSSLSVAKSGRGNMALSNLVGSNIFDILFCLATPWLLRTVYSSNGLVGSKLLLKKTAFRDVLIQSAALTYTALTLLLTVVIFFVTLLLMRWKINFKTGVISLALYLFFLTASCLYEFLAFGITVPC